MGWPEIEGDLWTVPAGRMKGKLDHVVPRTPAVTAIIGERPKDAKARPFVFSTDGGKTAFSGYSKAKAKQGLNGSAHGASAFDCVGRPSEAEAGARRSPTPAPGVRHAYDLVRRRRSCAPSCCLEAHPRTVPHGHRG